MTKLQDVADKAGVSTATVSRTLNNPELVDPVTRLRVENVIKSIGYKRNETARALAMRSSRTIGLLTDSLGSSHFGNILDAITLFLQKHDYFSLVETVAPNPNDKLVQRGWRSLINRQVEGIIVLSIFSEDENIDTLREEFPATVVLGQTLRNNTNCVSFDDEAGGRLAANYLLDNGHRDIAVIAGPSNKLDSHQRGKGFTDALKKRGVSVLGEHVQHGDYTIKSGIEAMRQLLRSKQKFTAVFAHNDNMAIGAITECYNTGVKIPEDVSLIGFDDSSLTAVALPPLTTIKQPLKQMSHAAATLAVNISKKKLGEALLPSPETHYLPVLVERQSVADLNK